MTPSLSFAEWLDQDVTLSPIQTRILHTLGSHLGAWVPTATLAHAVYRDEHHDQRIQDANLAALRTHIWRLRQRLLASPWRIESVHRSGHRAHYRLVP